MRARLLKTSHKRELLLQCFNISYNSTTICIMSNVSAYNNGKFLFSVIANASIGPFHLRTVEGIVSGAPDISVVTRWAHCSPFISYDRLPLWPCSHLSELCGSWFYCPMSVKGKGNPRKIIITMKQKCLTDIFTNIHSEILFSIQVTLF